MPNHCENDLYLFGPKDDVYQFIEDIRVTDEEGNEGFAILQSIYPCPEDLQNTTATTPADPNSQPELWHQQENNKKKYGYADWYYWCINNWGTKWGDYETELLDDWSYEQDGVEVARANITFQSAWSPPREGMIVVSQKYPAIEFRLEYFEQGMGFEGKENYKDGEVEELYYSDEYMGGRGG